MSKPCIFCEIAAGRMQADIVYEDNDVVAFKDIHPRAPVHLLVIPREHIPSHHDMTEQHRLLFGHIHWVAKQLADEHGIAESGYRTIFNCGRDGGQEVWHIHLHLLGGRPLAWPP